jgi:hypothetical protein
MIITKTALPRRTILRGLGAAVALPLLEAMVPAATALAQTPAKPIRRLSLVYIGNGAAVGLWSPTEVGRDFTLSPILAPLAEIRDAVTIVSGLENKPANALFGEPGGGHGRIAPAFLSAVHAKPTDGVDFRAAVTIDQVAARQLGAETQIPSLELQMESNDFAGQCDAGFSCAYTNTISWRTPTAPLPMENNPRAVFERLFGDTGSTDPKVLRARMAKDSSILDSVRSRVGTLAQEIGPRDRVRLDEYLTAVREVERRIQKAESQQAIELPLVEQPAGIPQTFAEHARLLFDLQVLAFQADLTRVGTFMLVRELSAIAYPEIGIADTHHPLSHHQDDPEKIQRLGRINAFHVKLFADYLQALRSTPDGEGTMLDHTALLYGGGMGNSNLHVPTDLPLMVAGGAALGVKGGQHLRVPTGTPLANLYVTLLNTVGVAVESVGDSTGALSL